MGTLRPDARLAEATSGRSKSGARYRPGFKYKCSRIRRRGPRVWRPRPRLAQAADPSIGSTALPGHVAARLVVRRPLPAAAQRRCAGQRPGTPSLGQRHVGALRETSRRMLELHAWSISPSARGRLAERTADRPRASSTTVAHRRMVRAPQARHDLHSGADTMSAWWISTTPSALTAPRQRWGPTFAHASGGKETRLNDDWAHIAVGDP